MKMMFSLIALALTLTALAGDNGGGTLDCKSSSGRTTLLGTAGVDNAGFSRANLVLTIDKKSLTFSPESFISRNGVSTVDAVSFDGKSKVYTLVFVEKFNTDNGWEYIEKSLSVVAIPASLKETSKDVYSFQAILTGADPRKNQKETESGKILMLATPISVNCSLDLSI
ncbi:MAG: hypothetical protein AB7I27_01050 [Bacteriovoracaceae bacterium]